MADQAERLRELVADQAMSSGLKNGSENTLDFMEEMIIDDSSMVMIDIAPGPGKLWATLEADLERWVRIGGFDKPNMSTESLAEFYEIMQRRREQQ